MFSWTVQAETVTDITGKTVEIPEKVERIILGEGRMLYSLALLDKENPVKRVVGWQGELKTTDVNGYNAYLKKFPQIKDIPLIGQTSEASVNPETVMSLNPDIAIFGIAGHGPGVTNPLVEKLQKAGVPVVFIDFRQHPMKNTIPSMKILGKVLHREEIANKYIAFYEKHLNRIQERVAKIPADQRPSVFIEMLPEIKSPTCCHTAGNGNLGEFIEAAGGHNIAADILPAVIGEISLEHVLSVDPKVYILSGTGSNDVKVGLREGLGVNKEAAAQSLKRLANRTGVNALTAVKDGNTHGIWHNFYNSPYNIIAIEAFAKWFYPELFSDVDVQETFNELQEFLPVNIEGTYWVDLKDAK
ncbi:iron ABC transporter substrate-binding protein [Entomomonas moraniae]|uniref:Iron ABC transporter substrate-binding protein n=2 Tax=Entomomonas moraniae TaxID=2213226 RepID=A0A3Q9JMS0_9GAMM|nr:iron ABC transporter substrate-binding protein [Entomomonas moraniae]